MTPIVLMVNQTTQIIYNLMSYLMELICPFFFNKIPIHKHSVTNFNNNKTHWVWYNTILDTIMVYSKNRCTPLKKTWKSPKHYPHFALEILTKWIPFPIPRVKKKWEFPKLVTVFDPTNLNSLICFSLLIQNNRNFKIYWTIFRNFIFLSKIQT